MRRSECRRLFFLPLLPIVWRESHVPRSRLVRPVERRTRPAPKGPLLLDHKRCYQSAISPASIVGPTDPPLPPSKGPLAIRLPVPWHPPRPPSLGRGARPRRCDIPLHRRAEGEGKGGREPPLPPTPFLFPLVPARKHSVDSAPPPHRPLSLYRNPPPLRPPRPFLSEWSMRGRRRFLFRTFTTRARRPPILADLWPRVARRSATIGSQEGLPLAKGPPPPPPPLYRREKTRLGCTAAVPRRMGMRRPHTGTNGSRRWSSERGRGKPCTPRPLLYPFPVRWSRLRGGSD